MLRSPQSHSRHPSDMMNAMPVTRGQLEAQISEFMTTFQKEHMGRGPLETRSYIIDDLLVVRMRGTMTPAEQQLAKSQDAKGRDLIKQVRLELLHNARPTLAAAIRDILRVPVVSMHADISTRTGESIIVFTLGDRPLFRENNG